MARISSELYQATRTVLLECGPFDSNDSVLAVFADPRIALWRARVMQTNDIAGRVNNLIARLLDRTNTSNENGLVLFLRVASDQHDPGDSCRQQLSAIAARLEAELAMTTNTSDQSIAATAQGAHTDRLTLRLLLDEGLVEELATCFASEAEVNVLLEIIGLPAAYRPQLRQMATSMDFWLAVCQQIQQGRVEGGFEPLLAAAAGRLPGNPKFAPYASKTRNIPAG